MGALFAKWDSLNGDLYFQDYICIQLQMIWKGGVAVAEGVGGVVSILFLCLWIIVSFELSGHLVQWVRLWGALLTRYHCQLPFFPACPYPFLRASNFILPSTKCHTLVTLVSLRQKTCSFLKGKRVEKEKKNFKEEEGERGKGGRDILINLLLDLDKVIWKHGVMFQGKLPIKYCKKIK